MPAKLYEALAQTSSADEVKSVLDEYGATVSPSGEGYKMMDDEPEASEEAGSDSYDREEDSNPGGKERGAIVISVRKKMEDYDKNGKHKGYGYDG